MARASGSASNNCGPILVSDFDGTMTRRDFYKLAVEQLVPKNTPDFWSEHRAGKITHFEALRQYFAAIRCSEAEVLAVVAQMELEPDLGGSIRFLQDRGWRIMIASAGCDWYIHRLLSEAEIDVEIHANPGRFEEGRGLIMELPVRSRYFSPTVGIDKAGIVSAMQQNSDIVAFAGDGFPDVEPALLIPGHLRFARSDLANVLAARNLQFHGLDSWAVIVETLSKL
jgi:2,3-diketo-5-methylthio-1-phosphopentane phosphatase